MDSEGNNIRLFVGLGNPGKKYEKTRHNIGFDVIDEYARLRSAELKLETKFNAEVAKVKSELAEVHMLKPLSYMNLSGPVVRKYLDYYKIAISDLVVVVDDAAIPFGQLRLRPFGASGGHNGLKSIQGSLGGSNYSRLRLGVGGSMLELQKLEDYVLEPFTKKEQEELDLFVEKGAKALCLLETTDVESAMSQLNTRIRDCDKRN